MVTNYVQNSSLYGVGESVVGQVRKANEDNCGYASTENGELFVVCDGMGGHVGGATASKIGVDSIINYISTHKHADKRVILRDALVFANMQILGTASADATLKGMGTTACIVLIDGDNTWLAHVGDSRIYLYSQKDKFLYRVSKDHSFVQGLVDSGQLDDRDAENHPQKNIILRALGIKEDMKPEVDSEPMHCAKGDIIMICSDGLSGMIDDVYMEKKIRDNKADLADLCQQLIDDANTPDKGKDNITCQLIRFEKASAGAPKHPDFTPKWRRPGGAAPAAASVPAACPAPEPKSKKMLWIGLAVLVVLIAGGIVGGMMYIAKHRHVFRPDAHGEYVLRSDNPEGINMNAELRPGVKPIEWTVTAKGVDIDANGYLKVDSATYEAIPSTRIKVRAEFRGKEYEDSILVHLEYVKVEKIDAVGVGGDGNDNGNDDGDNSNHNQTEELTISALSLQMNVDGEKTLTASIAAKWKSSDATIVKVTPSNDGKSAKVRALKDGSAIITVTSDDGQSKKCNVVVKKAEASQHNQPEKIEYVLVVNPLKKSLEGKGVKHFVPAPATKPNEVNQFPNDECYVCVKLKKGGKEIPINVEKIPSCSWPLDDVDHGIEGSENGVFWHKFSVSNNPKDDEYVFSFAYKDENGKDQKIRVQLKK